MPVILSHTDEREPPGLIDPWIARCLNHNKVRSSDRIAAHNTRNPIPSFGPPILFRPAVGGGVGVCVVKWVTLRNSPQWAGRDQLPALLADGIRVLIYAGDVDYICNWLGNKHWATALQWPHRAEFAWAPPAQRGIHVVVQESPIFIPTPWN